MRYLSVQLLALLYGNVAERNALHSNTMATRLARGLTQIESSRLLYPVEINEIFISLPKPVAENLAKHGFAAQLRGVHESPHFRFVTSWNTKVSDVDRFVAAAAGRIELARQG
jgi:threonine aldolase